MQGKVGQGKVDKSETAAKEVIEDGGQLTEIMTKCLLQKDNQILEELLEKMGRMVMRKASNISSGLSDEEVRN